ncbi:MAG: 4Fe-4S binding protein [Verrucomicrobia bacterium]|nr:4Fe-4S binding protein [Verrucomicrobiota bacterium]
MRLRPWVQTAFLGVWLAPLGQWLRGIPSCVFHCYSCPLSSFACPVGVAANYAALFPVAMEVPYLLLGVLLLAGAVSGSLACGWACPFGYVQDLLGKLSPVKLRLPGWLGYTRYVVLVGLVVLLPMWLGSRGVPFEEQEISICRLCPAGALEAGLPYSVQSFMAGNGWLMSWFKTGILAAFLLAALFFNRPWCRVLCPLGGFLALFNRFSLFHLRFNASTCVECNLCRSRCSMGVKLDRKVNVTGCVRCLECTTCGAVEPAFALPERAAKPGGDDAMKPRV